MKITQEYLVGDLELRLSKAKPSDELDIQYSQMAYWIDMARDEYTKEYIKEEKRIDESLIMEIDGLVPYAIQDKVYIGMDIVPLEIKNGGGVIHLYDSDGNFLNKHSLSNKKFMNKLRFAKASACTIVYSLTGTAIMIEGGSSDLLNKTYSIALVPSELSRIKNPQDRMYIAPSTVKAILEIAEEIGLREISQGIYDTDNDGTGNE